MNNSSNPVLVTSLKIISLLAFIFLTNEGLSARIDYLISTDNTPTLIVFSILWIFSVILLLAVSFQKNTIARLFWAIVIAVTTAISYGFYQAGGSELEVLDVLELWQARHETGRAFEHFQTPLFKAILVSIVGFVIIAYPGPKLSNKTRKVLSHAAWLPIIPIFLFSTLIFVKSDKAVAGLPQQFSPASMAAAISYKMVSHEIPTRNKVENSPASSPKSKHLLYLVDESINPNYLHTKKGKLLEAFVKHENSIADFGVSISGSNCSARSNAILRFGATKEDLIRTAKTNPTIWQYAKKAGFRTVFIDSQTSSLAAKPNDYQNYMTSEEAKDIDVFYKVKNVPTPELDYRLLELVKKELASETPTFIYANKNGAHFPYNHNYPEEEAIHQPVFKEGTKGLSGLFEHYKDENGLQMVINTYKNAVHWTVDKFFLRFFDEINLEDTVVIYTSDHGQYFKQNSTTHCTSGEGAPALEGIVPLMLMTGNTDLLTEFKVAAANNHNKTDHFSIFPTVLDFFGYSKEIQDTYGSGLFDSVTGEDSAFNTGDILGIISTDTIWREVSNKERMDSTPNVPRS